MPAQASDKTQRATEAGVEATRQGTEGLQEQMSAMLGTTGRVSQEAARRTSENLELMKRLAETMLSGAQEASSEMVEWTRQASERQAEATRQITQARGMEEMLDIQDRYIRTRGKSPGEPPDCRRVGRAKAAETLGPAITKRRMPTCMPGVLPHVRYIRGNLQALLDFSAKVSRLSADKASEASGHLAQG